MSTLKFRNILPFVYIIAVLLLLAIGLFSLVVPVATDKNSYGKDGVCYGPESTPAGFNTMNPENFHISKGEFSKYNEAVKYLQKLEADDSYFSVACSTEVPVYKLYL